MYIKIQEIQLFTKLITNRLHITQDRCI